jgi:glycosyltransferase involved in cell wall biosynthesis
MARPSLLVDLRVAQVHRERGIPRYCQSLVLALARERPGLEIACLVDPDRDPPLMLEQLARHCRIMEGTASIAAESRTITHFLQGGLFEGRKPVLTLFPAELAEHRPRLGAIVYDLIPWLFPEAYLSDAAFAHDYLRVIPALSRLDRLFAISESVRRDVIAIAGAEPSRVVTIYGGLDEGRWPVLARSADVQNAARDQLRIRNDQGESLALPLPFWLYVGGDDFRKNLPRLIEALALLKHDGRLDASLVVACSIGLSRRSDLLAQAAALGLRPGADVIFTGYVSDETLGRLFGSCMASVFPSLYEGLGLPVLESYAFGKPVLASDTSSFRELVPERCRFDPRSAASMADAMQRFRDDPRVAEESLAFAPQAIALCGWPGAARKFGEWLDGPAVGERPPVAARPLWVATSLPPDKSGVAFATQRSLGAPTEPVTFFIPSRGAAGIQAARQALARARHGLQHEAAPAEVLSLATLADARCADAQHPVLFVLGNSEHHLDTLAYLLTKGAGPRDAVHLHDVFLGGLLALHFGTERQLRAGLLDSYPADLVDDWLARGASADGGAGAILGPRLFVRRAGVRHFIVNSTAAADRLRNDLGDDAVGVRIDALFHPVLQPPSIRSSLRDPDRLRIGHFGMLRPGKHPDRLIAACDLLAARRRIELVFAGYAVQRYVSLHGLQRDYLRVSESPSDEELQEVMSGVDCAVQLRYPDHGESSGVVNQLLALRRPVVCTRTGSFAEMEGALHLVPPDVSPADLATAIEQAVAVGWPAAADALIALRSPWIFEARLRELLDLDVATAVESGQQRDTVHS